MRKLFYLLSAAMMLVVAISSCSVEDNPYQPVNPQEESADTARLTVIFYGTAGGSADVVAETTWKTMQSYLKQKDVRVVVCYKYGKPDNFTGQCAKPGDLVFFELTDTTDLNKIGENYAMEWPDFALYDETTLTSVIDIVAENAPARNYTFLLFGHGGGFDKNVDYEKDLRKADPTQSSPRRAVLYDEWIPTIAGKEAMNMYEFLRGIFNSKIPHFQSIFFHNCLMGDVETLLDIAPFCDYIVSSCHMLAMNQAPIRQFMKAVTEQTDIEEAYLQMLGGMRPEWDEGYEPNKFNGDLKLVSSEKLFGCVGPGIKLTNRLVELYPTMQAQLDTAMVHTYQYFSEYSFYDLGDYANKVAEYTNDPQLINIAKEMNKALDEAIIGRCDLHFSPYGDLPKFSLSVVLCSQEDYQKKTAWDYTFKEAYEYTNWHLFTDWGNWLNTTKQGPHDQTLQYKGQPVGQYFFE